MRDQLHAELAALRASALTARGALAPQTRASIFARAGAPDDPARALTITAAAGGGPDGAPDGAARGLPRLDALIVTIAKAAYRVTDADIQGLLADGVSEEAVYEAVICAALGAGYWRLERGLAALRAAPLVASIPVKAEKEEE
jgi:hypothetical protein